jgi:hypothetical protein
MGKSVISVCGQLYQICKTDGQVNIANMVKISEYQSNWVVDNIARNYGQYRRSMVAPDELKHVV